MGGLEAEKLPGPFRGGKWGNDGVGLWVGPEAECRWSAHARWCQCARAVGSPCLCSWRLRNGSGLWSSCIRFFRFAPAAHGTQLFFIPLYSVAQGDVSPRPYTRWSQSSSTIYFIKRNTSIIYDIIHDITYDRGPYS